MMQKKIKYILSILLVFCLVQCAVYGQEIFSEQQENDLINSQMKLLQWDHIQETQDALKQKVPQLGEFNLQEKVWGLIKGEERISMDEVITYIGELLWSEVYAYINIIARFLLIILMWSIMQTLKTSFSSNHLPKVVFFICYMLIIHTVLTSMYMLVQVAHQTIEHLSSIMMATIPTLLGFMAVSGYITSSSALAPVVIAGLNIITLIIQKIILTVVIAITVLKTISVVSEEIKIDKLVALFYKGTKYVLIGILGVSVGIMGIYKTTLPLADVVIKKGTLSVATAFLPVVGNVSNNAIEFIMGCAQLVKNSFGVGVIIWMLIVIAVPLIKMLAYITLYHIASAIAEPVAGKKMSDIAADFAKCCEFILSCVGIVAILCITVMLICISIGANLV